MARRRMKRSQNAVDLPSEAIRYRGPLRLPRHAGGASCMTTAISLTGTLATTGGGISQGVAYNTDITNATEWSYWASLYQEFRVLGFEWKYIPNYTDGFTTNGVVVPPQGAIATFHQVNYSNASSVAALIENAAYREFNLAKPMTIPWRMGDVVEANFQPTGSTPTYTGGVNWYTDGGTPSAQFGRFYVRFIVQFRGRK